jgi:hypothetical protein
MRVSGRLTSPMKLILLIGLLAVVIGVSVACEDFGLTPSEETTKPEPTPTSGPVTVNTKDAAILAVYLHLLEKAGSPDAKTYLSDFYTECDNWYAESEYYKDGSDVWHVVVDMTEEPEWTERSYWQEASWFILNNGDVVPSNVFQSNALRIEADLQALSANTSS